MGVQRGVMGGNGDTAWGNGDTAWGNGDTAWGNGDTAWGYSIRDRTGTIATYCVL